MNVIIEFTVSALILLGAVFALLGSIGLVRLPDFFTRLHGPTKATTLGVGAMVLASAIYFTATQPGVSLHEIAVMVFLFITAPVTAHLLAKAALHRRGNHVAKHQEKVK
ncbi:monovalent cation/proton antiporter, MnhG/PhaG subunit [Sulfuricella denitrificans skB26]|uniref:Monovalent cation/proton antiporter, MnhG/PhaG subunit n=1 Tax=Sulfuricella denitrificans (strain DSM 22764 / NBRC 105220 / skB26) TaxID=1163617 RepID=S6AAG4_SULDS|nr:Na+/H+ antiporter subunit G [Sulfuricella denitrificans]BAN35815.1 monovalent cation/proton antiporter, MnhG/PhaG subunit [Sulfuricella denitrificans skB26]